VSWLDWIPGVGWVKLAIVAAAVSALVGGVAWLAHGQREIGRAEVQAKWDAQTAEREKAAREASEENRRIEMKRASLAKEIDHAVTAENSTVRTALAAAAADAGRLRQHIELYAAVGGAPACNPGAPAKPDDRAATLGGLLATCREEAASDAGELEALATQVRGLQRSYRALTVP